MYTSSLETKSKYSGGRVTRTVGFFTLRWNVSPFASIQNLLLKMFV